MNEKVAVAALRQVKEVLDKHNMEYWLDSGTLLGAVRDGKLIEWEHDIDLGIWYKDISKIASACNELRDRKFRVNFGEDSIRIYISETNEDFWIDITMYRLNNDAMRKWFVPTHHPPKNGVGKRKQRVKLAAQYLMWLLSAPIYFGDPPKSVPLNLHMTLINISHILPFWLRKILTKFVQLVSKKIGWKYVNVEVPRHYFENLSTIKFYGMEFKVPPPVEEYLAYRYGKDWRIPKKDYIYYMDDGAVVKD